MKRLIFALAVLLCLALAAPMAGAAPTHVKVAFATWVGYGPLDIAQDKGLFAKYGLDVELMIIDDESQYAAAMASGNIDALGNVLDTAKSFIMPRAPRKRCCLPWMNLPGAMASSPRRNQIPLGSERQERRPGQKPTSYFFFLTALEKAGVPEDSLTIYEMGASDAGAAFVAGKLDAAVPGSPGCPRPPSGKAATCWSSKEFPRHHCGCVRDAQGLHRGAPRGGHRHDPGLVRGHCLVPGKPR